MEGVLLTVAYDGARFSGWASQSPRSGASPPTPPEMLDSLRSAPRVSMRTVQEALHTALLKMDPAASELRGASRTDAGVHAEGQAAAFDTSRDIEPRGWVLGLNASLDDDVAVRMAQKVPAGFDPRSASRGKRYRYRILLDPVRDPLLSGHAWRVGYPLNLEKMTREAERAQGTHDFRAFRSARDERQNTVRTLERVAIERETDRVIAVVVEGSAFMHNMVRIIAGTLVDVARGQLGEGAVTLAIASGKRDDLGETAPPHGLVLERVRLGVLEGDSWPR